MSTWNWSRATLCAAALTLCATSFAQWPARYNNAGVNGDEEAEAVAVDHRGNVYVAGKVYTGTTEGYDFGVISYDSAGNLRSGWPATYTGAAHGDDIPMAIAVDWEGNVYVAGISYGGTTRHNDFTVIKLDPGGNTVWPNSGTFSSPDYDFHNGAIRLRDAGDDGRDHLNEFVCSMAMKNEPGAQPTFAVSGPSSPSGGPHIKWRTIVFEEDATNGVRIKSGWPVDDFGTEESDTPRGVAIYTDNTVYVTGGVHSSTSVETFTTVRYKAGGNNASPVHHWIDNTWAVFQDKPNHGRAIALDYDGYAYVTGSVLELTTQSLAIGTRKIQKNPGTGTASQVVWTDIHLPSGGAATPNSISLSFEIESGLIKTYPFVTGFRTTNLTLNSEAVLTLRYLESGTVDWTATYATSGIDIGQKVTAAGRGNAYVIGKASDDYVFLGYRRSSSTRFTGVLYDNGGTDHGRDCVMGSAGYVYYTGASDGTGADFLTTTHTESPSSLTPTYARVHLGVTTGDEVDVSASDEDYLIMSTDPDSAHKKVIAEFTCEVTESDQSEISVTVQGHATSSGVREKIEVFDYLTAAYVTVADHPAKTSDAYTVLQLRNDPVQYMSGGEVRVRVTYYSNTAFTAKLNLIRWDLLAT